MRYLNGVTFDLQRFLPGFSPAVSLLLYALCWLALLGMLAVATVTESRHRRLARLARASLRDGVLAPGYVALHGRLEALEDPGTPVAEVTVTQVAAGKNARTGQPYLWRESHRSARARPFVLVLPDGQRVRVEADERVQLLQLLQRGEWAGSSMRTVSAALRHGETAYVVGTLHRELDPEGQGEGFRDVGKRWVLRAPSGKKLLLSTEPVQERHARREGFHGRWALGIALVGLVVQLGMLGRYSMLLLDGVTAPATYLNQAQERVYSSRRRSGRVQYSYFLRVGYEAGGRQLTVQQPLSRSAFADGYTPANLEVRYARLAPNVVQLGAQPHLDYWLGLAAFAIFAHLAWLYGVHTRRTRPWYDRERLDQAF